MNKIGLFPYPRIGLTGAARTGKDTVGRFLVDAGYTRVAFGDFIKKEVSLLDRGMEESFFRYWVHRELDEDRAQEVEDSLSYYLSEKPDPFTEDNQIKPKLRPLLEEWGMYRYGGILNQMITELPDLAVNTRLMRAREAQAWVDNGGVIWEVTRPGYGPETEFARQCLEEMRESGLISLTINNDEDERRLLFKTLTAAGLQNHGEMLKGV